MAQAPLGQTLHRVHASFQCLLDTLQLQQQLMLVPGAGAGAGGSDCNGDGLLLGIARDLLATGALC